MFGNLYEYPPQLLFEHLARRCGHLHIWDALTDCHYELHVQRATITAIHINDEPATQPTEALAALLQAWRGVYRFTPTPPQLLDHHCRLQAPCTATRSWLSRLRRRAHEPLAPRPT